MNAAKGSQVWGLSCHVRGKITNTGGWGGAFPLSSNTQLLVNAWPWAALEDLLET